MLHYACVSGETFSQEEAKCRSCLDTERNQRTRNTNSSCQNVVHKHSHYLLLQPSSVSSVNKNLLQKNRKLLICLSALLTAENETIRMTQASLPMPLPTFVKITWNHQIKPKSQDNYYAEDTFMQWLSHYLIF